MRAVIAMMLLASPSWAARLLTLSSDLDPKPLSVVHDGRKFSVQRQWAPTEKAQYQLEVTGTIDEDEEEGATLAYTLIFNYVDDKGKRDNIVLKNMSAALEPGKAVVLNPGRGPAVRLRLGRPGAAPAAKAEVVCSVAGEAKAFKAPPRGGKLFVQKQWETARAQVQLEVSGTLREDDDVVLLDYAVILNDLVMAHGRQSNIVARGQAEVTSGRALRLVSADGREVVVKLALGD